LCYQEDSNAEVDVNVVMNSKNEFVEVQGTAEGAAFPRHKLDELLDLAQKGISELLTYQMDVLN
jgi:ribonuclease PH